MRLSRAKDVAYFMVSVNDLEYGDLVLPADKTLKALLRKNTWQMGDSAANRRALKPGDYLVFYLAGTNRSYFAATARVSSETRAIFEDYSDPRRVPKLPFMELELDLSDVVIWKTPKPVRPLLEKLSFVEPRLMKYWGLYFRQAMRRLTKKDYSLIVRGAK